MSLVIKPRSSIPLKSIPVCDLASGNSFLRHVYQSPGKRMDGFTFEDNKDDQFAVGAQAKSGGNGT